MPAHNLPLLFAIAFALSVLVISHRPAREWVLFYPVKLLVMAALFAAARMALGHFHRTRNPRDLFRARRLTERLIAVRLSRHPALASPARRRAATRR